MTSTLASVADTSGNRIVHRGEVNAGPFMLRLCRLEEPITIRPPQSPHLKPFTFFTSRARERDGSEPLYLHMGFFGTLASAEKWAQAARARHPEARATIASADFWLWSDSDERARRPVDREREPAGAPASAPTGGALLTDTQVLDILERRRSVPAENGGGERGSEQIELLRPEDTGSRRALKEAVARGAPVSFAVQLHWSARAIELSELPSIALFKSHTLYAVETRRPSRSCFFLRLGFFSDAVSAKQVASLVRSSFASAAVVPVLEHEVAAAREACRGTSLIPCLVQPRPDSASEGALAPARAPSSRPPSDRRRNAGAAGAATLEQTLAQLAEREMWRDSDPLSDTGVRHLKVEVQEHDSARH
jgi:hypothetical protein